MDPAPRIIELAPSECRALLSKVTIGRVAVCIGALPAVRSVRFVVDGDAVVFRVASCSRLAQAVDDAVVAFHADHFDEVGRFGWSVLVQGRSRFVIDPAELVRLEKHGLAPWGTGDRPDRFVRLPMEVVTGQSVHWQLATARSPS